MSNLPELSTRAFENPKLIILPDVSTLTVELVLNSLDVGATEISVDIDSQTRDITVRDNGFGMNFMELQKIGNSGLGGLNGVSTRMYGDREKSLRLILRCSRSVKIYTRKQDSSFCYSKLMEYGKEPQFGMECGLKFQEGTSIIINGALQNRVAKQHFDKNKIMNELKTKLSSLKWQHPGLKISVTWNKEVAYTCDANSSLCEFLENFYASKTKISVAVTDTVKCGSVSVCATVLSTSTNAQVLPTKIFINNREVSSSDMNTLFTKALNALNEDLNCPYIGYVLNVQLPPELITITVGPIFNKLAMKNPEMLAEALGKIASCIASINQTGDSQMEFVRNHQRNCDLRTLAYSGTSALLGREMERSAAVCGRQPHVFRQDKLAGSYSTITLKSAVKWIRNGDTNSQNRGIDNEWGSRIGFPVSSPKRSHLPHVSHPYLEGILEHEVAEMRQNDIPATSTQYNEVAGIPLRTPENRVIPHMYTPNYYSIVDTKKYTRLNDDADNAVARTPKNRMIRHIYTPNYYNKLDKGPIKQNIMKRRYDWGVKPREEISTAKKAKTAKFLDKYPVLKFQNQHNRTEIESYLEKNITLKTKSPASSKQKQWTPVFKKRRLSYVDKSTQTIQLKNCKCSCDH